jgi:hypothetical protein
MVAVRPEVEEHLAVNAPKDLTGYATFILGAGLAVSFIKSDDLLLLFPLPGGSVTL